MEIHKILKSQDCTWKQNSVSSGETGIHLPYKMTEIVPGLNLEGDLTENINVKFRFTIFKNDFIKALSFIVSNLPLYKSSSQGAKLEDFTEELYKKYFELIQNFFGDHTEKEYECNFLLRTDKRVYLNNLNNDKFNIRDFFVEEFTALMFARDEKGKITMNVETGYISHLLLADEVMCTFALKCITYFRDKTQVWNNIDKCADDFEEGDSVKISGKGYKLTGMFKYVSESALSELNIKNVSEDGSKKTRRRRWYTEPFIIKGKTVYLSTEWYPDEPKHRVHLNMGDLDRFISNCFGKQYSIKSVDGQWGLYVNQIISGYDSENSGSATGDGFIVDTAKEPAIDTLGAPKSEIEHIPFSISQMITLINETGLLYSPSLVKRFAFSLMAKPFLILSGLAGSGKTQLAIAFANALVEDESQMCVVSVGADWTNREPLLGFPNALQEGKYVLPESGVLQLLIEANKPGNETKPYFLILDEMNMSYVERYFADFLSAMESHKSMRLWSTGNEEVPASIALPSNLFIIGTINVDETTYMFSPKVLDRANVIEFKISEEEMAKFLDEMNPVDRESINYKAAGMGESFVALSAVKDMADSKGDMKGKLKAFFRNLKSVNAEFGYRSATEIFRYVYKAQMNDDSPEGMKMEAQEILDSCIVQKLLPKLHGSRKKLEPVLKALWRECFENEADKDILTISKENVAKSKYPLTADKIQRMYEAAYAVGFTSFAEA